MSAMHTEGPWTLTHRGGRNFAVQAFEIRGMFGDSPNTYPIFNKSDGVIDGAIIYVSPADARLIAAAPEMRESLGAVRMMLRLREFDFCRDEPWAQRLIALLDRIDGEAQEGGQS